jgi:hypothetical protein
MKVLKILCFKLIAEWGFDNITDYNASTKVVDRQQIIF